MAGLECPQCGAPLPPGATECKYCGEKITPVSSQQPAQTYQQNIYPQQTQGYDPNQYQQQPQPQNNAQAPYQQQPQGYNQSPYPQQPQNYNQQQYPQNYPQNQNQQASYPRYQNPYGYDVLDPGVNPAWPIKNKILAGFLAIFLGTFGIHKFYLGKPAQGVLYLVFMCTGIPTIVSFIEGIIYLCSNDHNFQVKHQVRLQ